MDPSKRSDIDTEISSSERLTHVPRAPSWQGQYIIRSLKQMTLEEARSKGASETEYTQLEAALDQIDDLDRLQDHEQSPLLDAFTQATRIIQSIEASANHPHVYPSRGSTNRFVNEMKQITRNGQKGLSEEIASEIMMKLEDYRSTGQISDLLDLTALSERSNLRPVLLMSARQSRPQQSSTISNLTYYMAGVVVGLGVAPLGMIAASAIGQRTAEK